MPASQLAASSSIVAGQPSLSLEIPDDYAERTTILLLPSSPLPNCSWDSQEDFESVEGSDGSATSSPPTTPGLLWDSHPWNESSDTLPKSVFEDWDDAPYPNPSVIVEEDGVQTVLITPESPFYQPPPSPPPFDFAPFSTEFFPDVNSQLASQDSINESESSSDVPLTLVTAAEGSNGIRPSKGQRLFLDTATFSSLGNEDRNSFTLSPSLYHSPMVADDVPSWAPKGFMCGPDVPQDPLECIYSAGDVSPAERWDTEERLWSPILLSPLRTAPCS